MLRFKAVPNYGVKERSQIGSIQMKKIIFITILALATSFSASSDDTKAKLAAIDRYYAAQSPSEMLNSFVDNYSKQLPKKDAKIFREIMLEEMDIEGTMEKIKPIMAKHFTLEELTALANFFESKNGSSAMAKMGPYMAEFMPMYQAELKRVMQVWQEKYRSAENP